MENVLDVIPSGLHASIKSRSCLEDLTPYFHAARDALNIQHGGELFVPSGKYLVNLEWGRTSPNWPCASLCGEAGTVFDAFDKTRFAVSAELLDGKYPLTHIIRPKFANFAIVGDMTTLGFLDCMPTGVDIDRVFAINCRHGFYSAISHYGNWREPNALNCGVGFYFGNRRGAFPYLGTMIPGEWDDTAAVHSGNKTVIAPSARLCAFGMAFDHVPPRESTHIAVYGGTVESNRVGIFMPKHHDSAQQALGQTTDGITLDRVWFEGNGTDQTSLDWDGQVVTPGDINIGYGSVKIRDVTALSKTVIHDGADVTIDGVQLLGTFGKPSIDGVSINRARIDQTYFDTVIHRPQFIHPGVGKSCSCIIPTKVAFDGADFLVTPPEVNGGSIVRFGDQQSVRDSVAGGRLEIAPDYNLGFQIELPSDTIPGRVYALVFNATAATTPALWQIGNMEGMFASSMLRIHAGPIRSYVVMWQPTEPARKTLMLSREHDCRKTIIQSIAIMSFANRHSATEWCATGGLAAA